MRPTFRLAFATSASVAVVAATLTLNSHTATADRAGGSDALKASYDASAAERSSEPTTDGAALHTHDPGTAHSHNDPATKNAISRVSEAEADADTTDPTTPADAAANARLAAEQRTQADPALTQVSIE